MNCCTVTVLMYVLLLFVGSLFERIKMRGHLTEMEASKIIRDLADALDFLHHKGRVWQVV